MQQKLFNVKWAHTPYIIYPMTDFITIWLFGKNYLMPNLFFACGTEQS